MNTYTIEVTEDQLRLLSETCEKRARTIVGQLDHGIADDLEDALLRHRYEGKMNGSYWEHREEIRKKLDELHVECWNQPVNQYYGVKYSEESDALFDLYEVFRHQLWKDNPNRSNYITDSKTPFHWNSKIPLAKIKKLDNE